MKTAVTLYTDGCLVKVERATEKILQYLYYMLPSNHHLQNNVTLSNHHMCRDNNERTTEKILQFLYYMLPGNHHLQLSHYHTITCAVIIMTRETVYSK